VSIPVVRIADGCSGTLNFAALSSVYLMSKVYLGVSGPKWVENLMTQLYLDPRGQGHALEDQLYITQTDGRNCYS